MLPLTIARNGEKNNIKKINGYGDLRRRHGELGFVVGESVIVVSEVGGNMIIKIKNTRFAAIGAIRREMNNAKWTWFAVGGNKRFGAIVILGTCFNRPGVFSFA